MRRRPASHTNTNTIKHASFQTLISAALLLSRLTFTVSRLIAEGLQPRTSASQFLHLHHRFVLFVQSLRFVEFCIVWFLFYFQFFVILLPFFLKKKILLHVYRPRCHFSILLSLFLSHFYCFDLSFNVLCFIYNFRTFLV